MSEFVKRAGLGLALAWLWVGCAGIQLSYERPAAAEDRYGPVEVVLEDARVAGKGGGEPYVVGQLRNAFGMPFDVEAAPDREPSKVVRELISECLRASGFRVVDASSGAPQLFARLDQFWSDGYQHNRLWLDLHLELRPATGGRPVWSDVMNVNEGWTAKTAGFSQMNSGYRKLLESARDDLLLRFQDREFRRQYALLRSP